uniref:Peptidase A1 domain-containing protein n=1 Tax=Ananas comosus var. bracteatus TaxID=296719 RepID=A0A6V7NRC3_ANACO|nr:unnamed protein product [Ananas comosus var. bracteatus]
MKHIKMPPPKPTTLLFLLLHLFSTAPFTAPAIDYHRVNLRDIAFEPSHHYHHHIHNISNPSRNATANKHELSLTLLHRDAVSGRSYASHRDRVADLLSRDSARAASITRRLSPAYYYHVDDFGSEVVSGLDEGSGEYFVRVGVGSPPKDQYLVVDSGSDVIWVQCQPCAQCYAQSDPVFDPAESSSFAGITCDSPICGILRSDKGGGGASASEGCGGGGEGGGEEERCRYEVTYGDGSYTRGVLALETLTFGGSAEVGDVAIGCGQRNRGLFVGAAGLLGLGWGPMSLVGQLGGSAGGAFSYCLVTRSGASGSSGSTGSLVLGRTAAVPVGAVWVPLARNPRAPSFYYVGVAGLGVGGARLPLLAELFRLGDDGGGGVVMDTGTAVTRLPGAAYAALRDAFAAAAPELPRAPGVSIFDACYDLSGYQSVRVPTVSFYFADADAGGAVLTLPARNFLIPVDGGGTFCFAFAAAPDGGVSILGNVQQQGIQITVDAANGFVGFGPNTC